ncbi:MAG: DUF2314 domain-containing protein [Janthinobacterium lividum]
MDENQIFYSPAEDPKMAAAMQQAQATFKYFWRELSWEARRIVPALDLACVKVAFEEPLPGSELPLVEYMWLNDVAFDGDTVSGVLINDPDELTTVENGDFVQVPLSKVSDWLFYCEGQSYGGFTIQAMRAAMSEEERREHDEAWGLNFGDFNNILVVYGQKEHPENLVEHPMSLNMREKVQEFVRDYPAEITTADEAGYTFLHRETIAGNRTSVEVALQAGADRDVKTASGKTALDFARQLNWEHLLPVLQG